MCSESRKPRQTAVLQRPRGPGGEGAGEASSEEPLLRSSRGQRRQAGRCGERSRRERMAVWWGGMTASVKWEKRQEQEGWQQAVCGEGPSHG